MNALVLDHLAGPGSELARIAVIILEPALKNIVHRDALPCGRLLGIDRLLTFEAKDRLGIESEGIGFQAVQVGDHDSLGANFKRRAWRRLLRGHDVSRRIQLEGEPLKPLIAGHSAGHCLQPQPQA